MVAGAVIRDGRSRFAVARYRADGTLDTAFGTDGVVELCPEAYDGCWLWDVIVDIDDGVIATGGMVQGDVGTTALLRLEADGQLDPDFGAAGYVSDRASPYGQGVAVAIDSQRRIIVVQTGGDGHEPGAATYFTTVRYLATGQRDTSFGTGGIAAPAFDETGYHIPGDVLVDANDRPVVVGQWTVGADSAFGVVRYAVSGTRDAAFGSNGVVKVVAGNSRWAQGVSADAAGRLVVVGGSALVRLLPDGTRDPTFGTAGVAVGFTAAQWEIAHTATGELVAVGGDSMGSWVSKLGVARYRSSGIADTTFGTDGLATHGVPGSTGAYAAHLALQPDGKIVAVGNHGNAYPDMSFLVARVCP